MEELSIKPLKEGLIYGVFIQTVLCCGEPEEIEGEPNPHLYNICQRVDSNSNLARSEIYTMSMSDFCYIGAQCLPDYKTYLTDLEYKDHHPDHDLKPFKVRKYDVSQNQKFKTLSEVLIDELKIVGVRNNLFGFEGTGLISDNLSLYQLFPEP